MTITSPAQALGAGGFVSKAPVSAPDQPHSMTPTMARTVSPLDPSGSQPQAQFSLVLACDGNGWLGTFGVLVSALLCDLLPEGAIEASIAYLDEEDVERVRNGWVVGFDPATRSIDWADGTVLDGNSVLALGI